MELTGFIGLGHMGGALAGRLLSAGHPLVVHDLDEAATRPFAEAGARIARDAAEVAECASVVFLSLPSIDATRSVTGRLVGGGALRVVVETSTVGPAAVRELAHALGTRGVAVVDAPVSGGPRAVRAGTLSVMHAGSAEAVGRVLPQLESISGRRFDVGSEPGLAQLCKLVNNAISAAGMIAACEATVVGAKAGLDADTMLAAINAGSGRNAATMDKFPASILTGRFDYGGPMGLMLKDLALYLAEAERVGVPQTVVPATLGAWREAVERNGFDADYSCVIRHREVDAGVAVRSRRSDA